MAIINAFPVSPFLQNTISFRSQRRRCNATWHQAQETDLIVQTPNTGLLAADDRHCTLEPLHDICLMSEIVSSGAGSGRIMLFQVPAYIVELCLQFIVGRVFDDKLATWKASLYQSGAWQCYAAVKIVEGIVDFPAYGICFQDIVPRDFRRERAHESVAGSISVWVLRWGETYVYQNPSSLDILPKYNGTRLDDNWRSRVGYEVHTEQ